MKLDESRIAPVIGELSCKHSLAWQAFKRLLFAVLVIGLAWAGRPGAPAAAAPEEPPLQLSAVAAQAQPQPGCDPARSILVSGAAVVNVVPDRALIQLGVQSNSTSVRAVERANSNAIQAVMNAVRALGVESKDITTDWYVVQPVYENYEDMAIEGYRINNMIAITLRDVSKTSQVISAALQAGANQVINVDFYTSDLRKYRDQARELAMTAAREKAQALASAAGAGTGCVLSINENSWSSYNGWWGLYGRSTGQNQWAQNVIQNVAPAAGVSSTAGDEPISLGQISIRAEITASFGLK